MPDIESLKNEIAQFRKFYIQEKYNIYHYEEHLVKFYKRKLEAAKEELERLQDTKSSCK